MNETIRKQDERGAYLLGTTALKNLRASHVAVFGIGGVGSYAVEALARAGVGHLTLIDHDVVSESNINRQLVALHSTIGRYKTDVARDRISDIDPETEVTVHHAFFLPENADTFDFSSFDYIIDAVDTVAAKIELAVRASAQGVPIISCMGAGNKLDPTRFIVTDLFETSGDPLARVMRARLRKCGLTRLKVVCSSEPPSPLHPELEALLASEEAPSDSTEKRRAPGSLSFVPSVAGLIAAGEVVRTLSRGFAPYPT
jgi:tRNA A37 threonylcarbamoyladenosine dehydratase